MRPASLTLFVLAFFLVGCTPAWKKVYVQGDRAFRQGQLVRAATLFDEACRADKRASDACARADEAAEAALEEALSRGAEPCGAGDLQGCLFAFEDVRGFFPKESPQRRRVEAQLEGAGALHLHSCQGLPMDNLPQGVRRMRCVAAHADALDSPTHDRKVAEERRIISRALIAQVHELDGAAHLGAAAVHARMAQCIDDQPETAAFAHAQETRFRRDYAVPLRLEVTGLSDDGLAGLCTQLAATGALRCGTSDAGLVVTGALELSPHRHTRSTTEHEVDYVVGVDRSPNPEHSRLRREIERDRRELRELELSTNLVKAECDAAKKALSAEGYCYDCEQRLVKDRECDRADAFRDAHWTADQALTQKIHYWNRSPRYLEVERVAAHRYLEHTHRWAQPWAMEIVVERGGERLHAGRNADVVEIVGVERQGFAPAGIQASTALAPSREALREHAEAGASAALGESLQAQLAQLAEKERCQSDSYGAHVDCDMRFLYLQGYDPVTTWLRAFSEQLESQYAPIPCVPEAR